MLEVSAHFSENLPSDDHSYKTRRFSCELKQQVPDGADLTAVTQRLFLIVKANVRAQVEQTRADLEMPGVNGTGTMPIPAPEPPTNGIGNAQPMLERQPEPTHASDKQLRYILNLAKKAGLNDGQVRQLPMLRFHKASYDQVSASEASQLIDSLRQRKAA
jgi:hypothetical protein